MAEHRTPEEIERRVKAYRKKIKQTWPEADVVYANGWFKIIHPHKQTISKRLTQVDKELSNAGGV